MILNKLASGNHSQLKVLRGFLREHTDADKKLELHFDFNPSTISRTRTVEFQANSPGSGSANSNFNGASEVSRVTQRATVKAETFTVKILLDATDRMNAGDKDASSRGVQAELDILYYMVEPKLRSSSGAITLAALGETGTGNEPQPYASLLEFHWGEQVLLVLMTQLQFDVKEYLPNLLPYRAEVTLTFEIIQGNNELYQTELRRVQASAQKAIDSGAVQNYQSTG